MTSFLLRPVRQLAQSLIGNDTPRQIAWGFTLGMFIGLIPKGNLIAVLLMVLLFALRVNLSAGMLATGLFSWGGFLLDSFAHRIGSLALVWQPARPLYTWLYESPLGTWIGTNNTVVVGQLLIALYLTYPVYWFSIQFATRVQPRLSKWLLRYRAIRWVRGAEIGTHWGSDA
ncbi:MAG: TIGR03546 family protein [Planctomycetes bacterium]|nr:TIGR03546 family protein [Planctomycetota bacterium]